MHRFSYHKVTMASRGNSLLMISFALTLFRPLHCSVRFTGPIACDVHVFKYVNMCSVPTFICVNSDFPVRGDKNESHKSCACTLNSLYVPNEYLLAVPGSHVAALPVTVQYWRLAWRRLCALKTISSIGHCRWNTSNPCTNQCIPWCETIADENRPISLQLHTQLLCILVECLLRTWKVIHSHRSNVNVWWCSAVYSYRKYPAMWCYVWSLIAVAICLFPAATDAALYTYLFCHNFCLYK